MVVITFFVSRAYVVKLLVFSAVARQKNAVENQILVRDSKGINEEQVKEMKSAFDHFDKNDDGRLDHFEFRACLVSLGYNVDTEEHLVNHNVSYLSVVSPYFS